MSMGFVDTIMAGNLSPDDLAAIAIGSSFINPIFVFSIGLLMALNPIIAQHMGARRIDEIGRTVRHALYLSVGLAFISMILIRNVGWTMGLLGINQHVQDLAQGYMNAMSWGFLPIISYLALRFFNEGMSVTKPTMWFALLGLVFNICGNYVFMYGKLGFPKLGAVGTGWASALVAWIMFLGMFLFTYMNKPYKRFELFSTIKKPEWKYIKEILHIGVPNGLSAFMEVSMFALVALFMGMLGTNVVAGHQIAINIGSIIFMIPLGFSSAISVRVGTYIGKNDIIQARLAGYAGIFLCVLIAVVMATMLVSIPELLVSIYTNDAVVIEIAASLLLMAAIFQVSDGLQVSGAGALRGLKDTTIPMIVNFISYWLIGLPSGYLIGIHFEFGPTGLWVGLIAGLTVAAVLHNSRFYYLIYKKIPKSLA
ncbi:MATE family efflux transporter [bacterium]|nr:MAG: MATE family efflux transporter [bacterium]